MPHITLAERYSLHINYAFRCRVRIDEAAVSHEAGRVAFVGHGVEDAHILKEQCVARRLGKATNDSRTEASSCRRREYMPPPPAMCFCNNLNMYSSNIVSRERTCHIDDADVGKRRSCFGRAGGGLR